LLFEHKEDNDDSFLEEPNMMANPIENNLMRMPNAKKESMGSEHMDELENDEKNVLNLNLSFVKKEEDG